MAYRSQGPVSRLSTRWCKPRLLCSAAALLILVATPALSRATSLEPVSSRVYEHVSQNVGETANARGTPQTCPQDVGKCEPQIAARLPYEPLVQRYKKHLFDQGEDRWQPLPCALISAAQPHFPLIDLTRVRFANDISTLHGRAITWHYHIFFPWTIDLTNKADLFVMLHELEHVVQYEQRGGEQAFLREYIQKARALAIAKRSWRIHGDIDLEQAAEAKAKAVFAPVYKALRSSRMLSDRADDRRLCDRAS